MKILLFVSFFLGLKVFAQDELVQERVRFQQSLDDVLKREAQIKEKDAEGIEKLNMIKERLLQLATLESKRDEWKAQVADEVSSSFESMPFHLKAVSRKAKFYRCVRDSLSLKDFANVKGCKENFPANFTTEELTTIDSWQEKIGKTARELSLEKTNLESEEKSLMKRRDYYAEELNRIPTSLKFYTSQLDRINSLIKEEELLAANKSFTSCDANTATINLEEKSPYPQATFSGPFYGIPRDNQDGIGSCFANTAKNLLVGLSGGEDVASFLDMALQYKKSKNNLSSTGLDGGGACDTLRQIASEGYCPQEFSPFEQGEKNLLGEGLIAPGSDSVYAQSEIIRLLKNHLQDKEKLKQNGGPVSESVLRQSHAIVETLKKNSQIKFPLPVARFEIPSEWKLKETYALLKETHKKEISEKDFIKEHRSYYKKFFPQYVKAIMEGKNADQIFSLYEKSLEPFTKKYETQSSLESYKIVFKNQTESDFKDPSLKKTLQESIDLLKKVSDKSESTDEEFLHFCMEDNGETLQFFTNLNQLVQYMSKQNIDASRLFDEQGNFLEADQLMQLAVAPACLNTKNRKKLNFEFSCDDGIGTIDKIKNSGKPLTEQIQQLRNRVVAGLLQGNALGNIVYKGNSGHINSIVGMRFNTQKQRCEYNIRESQTGTSDWHSEADIFSKINGLTEVRKK